MDPRPTDRIVRVGQSSLSERIARRISPWALVTAMVVFLLPFATVSCATPGGQGTVGAGVTAKYSGLTLALGGDPTLEAIEGRPTPGPPTAEDRVPLQPLFTLALVLTAVAVAIAIRARHRRALGVAAFAAAAGASATVGMAIVDRWLTDRIVATLARQSSPRLATTDPATYVNADLGFFLLVLLLLGTLAMNAVALIRSRPPGEPEH
ncbi:MAG TPA: hypothetical protein VJ726_05825 [Candidatus Limnocylindria bacterium]|nr:hypothetical protein [Candidatus Limnocylindria bacterium]